MRWPGGASFKFYIVGSSIRTSLLLSPILPSAVAPYWGLRDTVITVIGLRYRPRPIAVCSVVSLNPTLADIV